MELFISYGDGSARVLTAYSMHEWPCLVYLIYLCPAYTKRVSNIM